MFEGIFSFAVRRSFFKVSCPTVFQSCASHIRLYSTLLQTLLSSLLF